MPLVDPQRPIQPFSGRPDPSGSPPTSLDAIEQEFADALTGHRACQWGAGDVAARALKSCRSRKQRRVVANALAATGHCAKMYVVQMARVAKAFPGPHRKPDVSWSLYRACLQASTRETPWNAVEILEIALGNGWHCKEVNALGKGDAVEKPKCPTCGK